MLAESTPLQGSYRTVHKGFEEVHVPALKPKPFADGEVWACGPACGHAVGLLCAAKLFVSCVAKTDVCGHALTCARNMIAK